MILAKAARYTWPVVDERRLRSLDVKRSLLWLVRPRLARAHVGADLRLRESPVINRTNVLAELQRSQEQRRAAHASCGGGSDTWGRFLDREF